jgi:hypothetical protein
MNSKHILKVGAAVLALSLVLAPHANAETRYQPSQGARVAYGYSETVIDANRMRVSFSADSRTSRETVEKYLLFRAAEITLQRGFDNFVVVDHFGDQERFRPCRTAGPTRALPRRGSLPRRLGHHHDAGPAAAGQCLRCAHRASKPRRRSSPFVVSEPRPIRQDAASRIGRERAPAEPHQWTENPRLAYEW